jgi:serine/threonine protein kinase
VGLLAKLKQWFRSRPKSNMPRVDISKRFELLNRTGQGSMSKVWRARDKKLGRIVCLKILDKKKTKEFEDRFIGLQRPPEGVICLDLRHPNIVQTFEYGQSLTGEPFLVMELIEGGGLNLLIETKSPSLKGKRLPYLIQLADALEYVHQKGYLHRDICPRNAMVTNEGVVKLIDFGLTIPYKPEFCKPGNRTGTTAYLAPELIRRSSTDHRVDLFALGVTAYELFTGELPWERAQSLPTLLSHLRSPGKDPRAFRPDLDDAVAQFLIKAIERDPRDRFQTVGAFRDALKALPKKNY